MGELRQNFTPMVAIGNPIDEGLTFSVNKDGKSKMLVPAYETSLLLSGMLIGVLLGFALKQAFSNSPQIFVMDKDE